MTTTIEAVYEKGLLRPLTPLVLPEGQRVQVFVAAEESAQGQDAAAILAEIAALPVESPADPTASRDHDRFLYGETHQP